MIALYSAPQVQASKSREWALQLRTQLSCTMAREVASTQMARPTVMPWPSLPPPPTSQNLGIPANEFGAGGA